MWNETATEIATETSVDEPSKLPKTGRPSRTKTSAKRGSKMSSRAGSSRKPKPKRAGTKAKFKRVAKRKAGQGRGQRKGWHVMSVHIPVKMLAKVDAKCAKAKGDQPSTRSAFAVWAISANI